MPHLAGNKNLRPEGGILMFLGIFALLQPKPLETGNGFAIYGHRLIVKVIVFLICQFW